MLAYGAIVLLFVFVKTNEFVDEATRSESAWASLLSTDARAFSIQGMMVREVVLILTPKNYISLLASLYQSLRRLTGIDRRNMIGNIFVFFIFYYLVVSAPAAVMRPGNYPNIQYNTLSLFALGMMMLTNAIGDVISLKLTFRNVGKLKALYEEKSIDRSVKTSYWVEIRLYFTTMIDTLMALCVLFIILLLTSVFFGWSIDEYGIRPLTSLLEGALRRIQSFWPTVNEPYVFATDLVPNRNFSEPMLLIFSLTTFIPTLLLLAFSIIWTLLMPLRIVFHTNLHPVAKIFLSEAIVFALCSVVLSLYSYRSNFLLLFENEVCYL